MKAKIKILALILGATIFLNSCIGSFTLTNKVYDWNNRVGDKYVNELVFLILVILPVYEATFIIDGILLNSIEFWTGDNPLAMEEGKSQKQVVSIKGHKIEITASKNTFNLKHLTGKHAGENAQLIFNETKSSWELHTNGETKTISKHSPYQKIVKFYPTGDEARAIDINTSSVEN